MSRSPIARSRMSTRVICAAITFVGILITGGIKTMHATNPALASVQSPPTVDDARRFVEAAEARLMDLSVQSSRASWVHETFITDDTEKIWATGPQALKPAPAKLP